jgi:hypothetical protein
MKTEIGRSRDLMKRLLGLGIRFRLKYKTFQNGCPLDAALGRVENLFLRPPRVMASTCSSESLNTMWMPKSCQIESVEERESYGEFIMIGKRAS